MSLSAEQVVDNLLEQAVNEVNWKGMAAAGLIGAAALHPGARQTALKAGKTAVNALTLKYPERDPNQHYLAHDPSKPLPSEADLSAWDYAAKKDAERERLGNALAPVTQKYMYDKPQ